MLKQQSPNNETQSDVLKKIDIIIQNKWIVAVGIIGALAIGGSYAILSTPIYQSNALIQVEQTSNSPGSFLGQIGAIFEVQSPAIAEIEILKSRMVIGEAAEYLQLHTQATPNRLPVVGEWLSKNTNSLSNPGFLGVGGYVTGSEKIEIKKLLLPEQLVGKTLILTKTENGYNLEDDEEIILHEGKIGAEIVFPTKYGNSTILVESIDAKPNAEFKIKKKTNLQTIADIQKNLEIGEKGKQSGIINITLEGEDSQLTTKTLKAITESYVNQNIRRKAAEAEKSLAFLDSFLPELRKQMQTSEDAYTNFRDKNKTFNLTAEGKVALETSSTLQTNLIELQQKKRELTPQYTENHPKIKIIDQQIKAIKTELEKIIDATRKMPEMEQQLLNLTRNAKVNSELYVNLLNSAQQLRLVKEGKVGNVRIVDHAVSTGLPVKPKKLLILIASLIVGTIIGIGLALLRARLRPGVEEASEIEEHTGLHVFATIPRSPQQIELYKNIKNKDPGLHVLAVNRPQDAAIESLRSLNTAFQFAMLSAKNNIIIITGPTPGIGKSFISVNFAAILGASGKRVLLIDAELRKGYTNQYFDIGRKNGFSELAIGQISIDDAVHKNVMENVDYISTGQIPPNPSELIINPNSMEIIKKYAEKYDLVIIDTAPVLAVADTLAITNQVGAVFLVTRAEVSTLGEIAEARKRIQNAGGDVTGVIFNDVTEKPRLYGSRYAGYSYTNYQYGEQ